MTAVVAGARLAAARLAGPRVALAVAVAVVVAASIAVAERRLDPSGAASRALAGGIDGLVVPLVATWLVARALDGTALRAALDPWARFGASRRALGAGAAMALLAASATTCAVAGAAGAWLAHGRGALSLAADVGSSAWIAALAGATYAALALAGSTLGPGGRGRWTLLVVDVIAGGSSGVLGALTPRAHVRNLLGGEPPLALAQSASTLALVAMLAALVAVALARTER